MRARDIELGRLAGWLGVTPLQAVALTGLGLVVFASVVGIGLRLSGSRAAGRLRKLPCRWRRDGFRSRTRLVRWVCANCGVEAYAMGRSAPKECKRALRETAL